MTPCTFASTLLRPGILGLLLALAPGATLLGAQEPLRLTMAEAERRALDVSPVLAQSAAGMLNAEQSQRTARGAYLPTLSASSGTSRSSSTRFDPITERNVTGTGESYSAGLSTGFDLYTGGRRGAEMDRARADLGAAGARVEDQRYAVILQTRNLFVGALRQGDLLQLALARLERAEESLDFTRRRAEVGTGTRSDTLRARLEVMNARQAVLQNETALRNARQVLGRQVGFPGPVEPEEPEGLEPRPLPLSEAEILRLAEEASPSVRSAQAAAMAAGASVSSARSAYLPALRLSSGYSWNNNEAVWQTGSTGWNVSLSASYPIFNGFGREANVARAVEGNRVARLQEADARLQARVQADAALRGLETAERAIDLAEETVLVAEEDLRVIQQRYDVGVATILDLITSQIAVDQAATDLVIARFDYAIARAELAAILGREL